MSLAGIIRESMTVLKGALGDIPVTVLHQSAGAQNEDTETTPGAAVSRLAVVVYKMVRVGAEDREFVPGAQLVFIEAVAVTLNDVFTLPDGRTGPVIGHDGAADSGTSGLCFAHIVTLGPVSSSR